MRLTNCAEISGHTNYRGRTYPKRSTLSINYRKTYRDFRLHHWNRQYRGYSMGAHYMIQGYIYMSY